jgi:serine/threonine protein kinase
MLRVDPTGPAVGGATTMIDPVQLGAAIGGYRIDEFIGRGGMGVVYRATNVALGRIYALKVLRPELADDENFQERFRREMQIAASLNHPNVVAIHHAGEGDGMLFFVMDFIYGADLHDIMRKSGSLEPSRATALLTQLASALDAAHRRGLVHRDVKPANVLITVLNGEEHAYLTDFGLAKKLHASTGFAGLTKTGAVVGTVDYMSPEQITGRHTDARTDIYALGCVFFQMLSGHVPYERDNSVATMFAHVNDPPPRLAGELCERYPTLAAVVEKATAKEPDDRYLSAGDFARDADAALTGGRYTGPATVVATGEATPVPKHQAEPSEPGEAATESGHGTGSERRQDFPAAVLHKDTPPLGMAAEPPSSARRPRSSGAARPRLRRYRWALVALLVCVAGGAAAAIALSSSSSPANNNLLSAAVSPVPTNRVTGSGSAKVVLKGDVATITIDAHGLVNQLHWMHIHGGTGECPTAAAAERKNGHVFISYYDGGEVYGPPVTSLTTSGDTSVDSHLNTTRYEKTGSFIYARTINVGVPVAKEIRAGLAVIVVHGISYDGKPAYDNYLGPGEEQGAPALCGVLSPGLTAAARAKSPPGTVYTASLTPLSTLQAISVLWFCHGIGATSALSPTTAEARTRGAT